MDVDEDEGKKKEITKQHPWRTTATLFLWDCCWPMQLSQTILWQQQWWCQRKGKRIGGERDSCYRHLWLITSQQKPLSNDNCLQNHSLVLALDWQLKLPKQRGENEQGQEGRKQEKRHSEFLLELPVLPSFFAIMRQWIRFSWYWWTRGEKKQQAADGASNLKCCWSHPLWLLDMKTWNLFGTMMDKRKWKQ